MRDGVAAEFALCGSRGKPAGLASVGMKQTPGETVD